MDSSKYFLGFDDIGDSVRISAGECGCGHASLVVSYRDAIRYGEELAEIGRKAMGEKTVDATGKIDHCKAKGIIDQLRRDVDAIQLRLGLLGGDGDDFGDRDEIRPIAEVTNVIVDGKMRWYLKVHGIDVAGDSGSCSNPLWSPWTKHELDDAARRINSAAGFDPQPDPTEKTLAQRAKESAAALLDYYPVQPDMRAAADLLMEIAGELSHRP